MIGELLADVKEILSGFKVSLEDNEKTATLSTNKQQLPLFINLSSGGPDTSGSVKISPV